MRAQAPDLAPMEEGANEIRGVSGRGAGAVMTEEWDGDRCWGVSTQEGDQAAARGAAPAGQKGEGVRGQGCPRGTAKGTPPGRPFVGAGDRGAQGVRGASPSGIQVRAGRTGAPSKPGPRQGPV